MILDQQLLFSDAQAVTATAASTNYLDLTSAKDLGPGNQLETFCHLSEKMTDNSGTDLTFTVALQVDSDSGFGTAATIWSRTYTYAEVYTAIATTGGFLPGMPKIPANSSKKRYMRAYYTVANGTAGGGTVTCGLTRRKPGNEGVKA